jgi:hypothetical protein
MPRGVCLLHIRKVASICLGLTYQPGCCKGLDSHLWGFKLGLGLAYGFHGLGVVVAFWIGQQSIP